MASGGNHLCLTAQFSFTLGAVHHRVIAAVLFTGRSNFVLPDSLAGGMLLLFNRLCLAAQFLLAHSAVHHRFITAFLGAGRVNLFFLHRIAGGVILFADCLGLAAQFLFAFGAVHHGIVAAFLGTGRIDLVFFHRLALGMILLVNCLGCLHTAATGKGLLTVFRTGCLLSDLAIAEAMLVLIEFRRIGHVAFDIRDLRVPTGKGIVIICIGILGRIRMGRLFPIRHFLCAAFTIDYPGDNILQNITMIKHGNKSRVFFDFVRIIVLDLFDFTFAVLHAPAAKGVLIFLRRPLWFFAFIIRRGTFSDRRFVKFFFLFVIQPYDRIRRLCLFVFS